jgi:hypothetical protein
MKTNGHYAPDAQSAVLGSIALDNGLISEVELSVSDFVGSRDQTLYGLMAELSAEGEQFDIATLAQKLEERGLLESIGGPAHLGKLIDGAVPHPGLVRSHCATIKRNSRLRDLGRVAEFIGSSATTLGADPDVILARAKEKVDALVDGYDLDGNLRPYGGGSNLKRRPELLRLSTVEAKEVNWTWRTYLAFGMLCMLSGDPGAGKTFVAMAIAASLTLGRIPYTGDPCDPVNVCYLSAENSPHHVVRPRFDRLGGDPERFYILQGSIAGDGESAERGAVKLSDIELLRQAIIATKSRFIIVDPIQSYLGAEIDSHRSNETRPVLDGLARLAADYECCVLLVRHFAKTTTGRAIHRGLGSIDLTGAVRTELHCGLVDEQRVLVVAKSNIGQLGKSLGYCIEADGAFRWTGESSLSASDLQVVDPTGEERGALEDAIWHLREALKEGAKPAKDIQRELRDAGLTEATIRRAKTKMGVVSQKTAMTGAWMWTLPSAEDAQASLTQNLEPLREF